MFRGETFAILCGLRATTGKVVITTDCRGAWLGCRALARTTVLPRWARVSNASDLWRAIHESGRLQDATLRWMPAHQTVDELVKKGYAVEDWAGNDAADRAAKATAARHSPPPETLQAWKE